MMRRRRFLTICAALPMAASCSDGRVRIWRGRALGADAEVRLAGAQSLTATLARAISMLLRRIDGLFSIYDAKSAISRLNRDGVLTEPHPLFVELMMKCQAMTEMTGGLFDASVQPLWADLARGGDGKRAREVIGWHRVEHGPGVIRLAPGQALSFNGIAQGLATDLAYDLLREAGCKRVLVNIGEYRAGEGAWRIAMRDPDHGPVTSVTMTGRAFATTSPGALRIGRSGTPHVLHPQTASAEYPWSTVGVEAGQAVIADGLSTALSLAGMSAIEAISERLPQPVRIRLVDKRGRVFTRPV